MAATMRGRVCVVTGATGGIGGATARALAALGATVVLAARSRERGKALREQIARETGNPEVHLVLADLAVQAEVRRMAAELLERFDRLHVLVHNAAAFTWRRTLTAEGAELQFAVDHLAPFLLTHLLRERLVASAPARVVVLTSAMHHYGRPSWEEPGHGGFYNGLRAYADAKLANVLFTRELARRLEGSGVTANVVHPGLASTEILFGSFPPLRLLRPLMPTPEQAARTVVHLAASREMEGVSGEYFARGKPARPSRLARDPVRARRLWEISEQMTGVGRRDD